MKRNYEIQLPFDDRCLPTLCFVTDAVHWAYTCTCPPSNAPVLDYFIEILGTNFTPYACYHGMPTVVLGSQSDVCVTSIFLKVAKCTLLPLHCDIIPALAAACTETTWNTWLRGTSNGIDSAGCVTSYDCLAALRPSTGSSWCATRRRDDRWQTPSVNYEVPVAVRYKHWPI